MKYDYIFITHLPAFYKINLYNKLAEKLNIFVIFISKSSSIRTKDFISGDMKFPYKVINSIDFEKRNKIISSIKLFFILNKLKYKKVVVGGWDLLEFWIVILLNKKEKNCLVVESTNLESSSLGLKGKIKKLFLNRITLAFPSGKLHIDLLKELGYKEKYSITKGVGIFNRKIFLKKERNFSNKFLYVGRLSEEKNLEFLIKYFNEKPKLKLTIVGKGPEKEKLVMLKNENISFIDHVDNKKISEVYLEHDVFILPSKSEPWGLVVDEALYFGLPVIVSNRVGCASELVNEGENGEIFKFDSKSEFEEKINKIISNYELYKKNVENMNFDKRDLEQVNSYMED